MFTNPFETDVGYGHVDELHLIVEVINQSSGFKPWMGDIAKIGRPWCAVSKIHHVVCKLRRMSKNLADQECYTHNIIQLQFGSKKKSTCVCVCSHVVKGL